MRFSPKRTQSVVVLVACAVAIMLVFAFVRYRTDFNQALTCATQLDYWRGVTHAGGELAQAYEQENDLKKALSAIDEAVDANKHIPDELYFVPRNLAIKSEIIGKLGHRDEADEFYKKSATIIDSLLKNVPTRNVERLLLAEMGEVYAGYFNSTCSRYDDDQALRILEEARRRIEAQALQHHEYAAPHASTPAERRLTLLNIALLVTDNRARRQELTDRIYNAELMFDQQSLASATIEHPVSLSQLKSSLARDEVLID